MAALLPILALIVLMYFLLIRPQQQRVREQQALWLPSSRKATR